MVHEHFDRAVIVDIPECRSTRCMLFEQRWPGLFRQVRKPSIPKILIEQRPILIANVYTEPVDFGIGVAVDQQKVFPAVIVEIKEAATQPTKRVL